ncbi:MAG TPA: VTT domain-containing protein [Opitutaceae bacterium]|jgi:uncharacterized membrane protein YdjX (TVP38/TMEM64 family)
MVQAEARARRKLPVVPIVVAVLVIGAAAVLVLRGMHPQVLMDRAVQFVRGIGPWAFFAATAILPALGAPLTAFTITAGEVFAPQMTMAGVIAATLAAIAVNLALTYWLARHALRPLISRVAARYGYSIPTLTRSNALSITLALRLTPGPPFFLQSYILGLAEAPFGMYMIASWLAVMPWTLGAIILGKGALNGNFKLAMYGIGVLAVATIILQAVRRRYVAKSG